MALEDRMVDSASRRHKSLVKYQVASATAQQCHLLDIFFPCMPGTHTLLSPLTLLAMPSPLLCLFLSYRRAEGLMPNSLLFSIYTISPLEISCTV